MATLATFLTLDGRTGWQAASTEGVVAVSGGPLQLQPLPGAGPPLVDATGSFGGLLEPTGLAVDADGRTYVLDQSTALLKRYDPCAQAFETLPCIGGAGAAPRQLLDPHGIAISCRGDLYVADSGNRRIQIFTLKGLALRTIWGPLKVVRDNPTAPVHVEPVTPQPVPSADPAHCGPELVFPTGTWRPWDIALSPDNWAYVSDYDNGLIHLFDRHGGWRAAYDGATTGVPALQRPTHIAVDRDCRIYVLQEGAEFVTVLAADGSLQERVERPAQIAGRFVPTAIAVDADGTLLLTDATDRALHVFARQENRSHAYGGRCPDFAGRGTALALDHCGNALVGDAATQRVLSLRLAAAYESRGRYYSTALDSRIYRCEWHRVEMHATVPRGGMIDVETFTSEVLKSDDEVRGLPDDRWATGQVNTKMGEGDWDCLIQSAPGRYLWVRLTLVGDGAVTPAIARVRVYFPRATSLQYLPTVYSEDPVSRDFTGRFLAIFDRVWDGIAQQIGGIARYFDPAATPVETRPGQSDFLSWLASWLALSLDRRWPPAKRRALVRHAHQLYAHRGTPAGLRLHLKLYAGIEPRILEHYRLRRWLFVNHARLGDQSALWGAAIVRRLQLGEYAALGAFQLTDTGDPLRDPFYYYAHQFTVFVPACNAGTVVDPQVVEDIVALAKPAHTQAIVQLVQPRFRIGVQAFVGVDTVVGRYPSGFVAGEGALGRDTVLDPSADEAQPPTMRVGVRARIGSDTVVD